MCNVVTSHYGCIHEYNEGGHEDKQGRTCSFPKPSEPPTQAVF